MKNKKGFYAVFFVCMVLVFGYGLILTMKNIDALKEARDKEAVKTTMAQGNKGYVSTTNPDKITTVSKSNMGAATKHVGTTNSTTDKTTVAKNPKEDKDVADDGAKTTVFNPVEKMLRPVSGKILKNYGTEFSSVTADWGYNDGVDFAVRANEKILAALSGKVLEVGYKELQGIYVIIDHGDGLRTLYGNLGSKSMVKKGQVVKRGDAISVASKTFAIGAFTDKPHVHFEVLQNGKTVNPVAKLPK